MSSMTTQRLQHGSQKHVYKRNKLAYNKRIKTRLNEFALNGWNSLIPFSLFICFLSATSSTQLGSQNFQLRSFVSLTVAVGSYRAKATGHLQNDTFQTAIVVSWWYKGTFMNEGLFIFCDCFNEWECWPQKDSMKHQCLGLSIKKQVFS